MSKDGTVDSYGLRESECYDRRNAKFYRMFYRIFDDGLAQSSYVIACNRTRQAAVVDPRRDIDVYVEYARQFDLVIRLAIETHVHADFVSGARELAALGATIIAGPGANLQFDHHESRPGEVFSLGDVSMTLLHTPGHTPEHISVLVEEAGEAPRVLTGDTLFVGAVGRPDLLGPEHARELAGELHVSLQERLMTLADEVEVHPGHGAGSLCGTGIGREPHSTIGRERRFNPMLRFASKEEFIEAVLADLPETPPYFAELKRINQAGPALLGLRDGLPVADRLTPGEAAAAIQKGAYLIDLRPAEMFAEEHPRGAINIGSGSKVGYWAGWVVPIGTAIVLFGEDDARRRDDVRRQLLRVGLDRVLGFVDGGLDAWRNAGLATSRVARIDARELHDQQARGPSFTIVDVRSGAEFDAGHIPGAINIPVGVLPSRLGDIPSSLPVATLCEGGYRSSLAASLLAREGFESVFNIAGGMSAYRALEATVNR
jgi:hydroxyacylglutathione hydrolase